VGSQRSSDGELGDLEAEMTSATMKRARGENRDEGYGLVVFAAMLVRITGVFNVIDGIAAIARSSVFTANAKYVFGDLRT
jgi:hypothetical protein